MRFMRWVPLLALCSLACGKDAVAPPVSPLAGTYALHAVNGQPLPTFAWQMQGGYRGEITGGTMELTDRTYWEEIVWRVTSPGGVNEQLSGGRGTYVLDGSTVRFEAGFSARAGGDTLVVAQDDRVLVFLR